ncbi:hypothetical protein [Streptomyces sp. KR80]|uniref:hypothetical protein n=1 Tax=Streptomyces sp. KR80 TaxID=3457426 RepID=UPI003FD22B2B
MRRGLPAAAAVVVALTALGSGGCGIRGTSVPVDAGPAPSRASCEVSGDRASADGSGDATGVQVHLICSTQILSVDRTVRVPADVIARDPGQAARALLQELQKEPTVPEKEAGFSSEVPDSLAVDGPREGDPEQTLRLSRSPDELPAYALAQLVCTFAEAPATGEDHAVVLGGPADDAPERYRCTESLRSRPDAPPALGVPVD